jgi:LPXTG-site transpeptidase (sortase) family protein
MKTWRRYWYAFSALFVLAGLAVGSWLWSGYNAGSKASPSQSNAAHAQSDNEPTTTATDLPWWKGARLIVPSLHIDAPIETVGKLPDGTLAVPTDDQWDGVGWYANGPVPGKPGSAVIDGHLDRPGGAPAVFWNLHELKPGDTVEVDIHQGKKLHFRVMTLQAYVPQEAPLATIFGKNTGSYLNLITCAGQWVAAQHQTTQRLVVYTELVS